MNETAMPLTMTAAPVADHIRINRDILISTLARYGLGNYPDEWWHFSYGDRLWDEIAGRTQVFLALIDYDFKGRVTDRP
jgi:D-alanyl-D-alanine dipeptidase